MAIITQTKDLLQLIPSAYEKSMSVSDKIIADNPIYAILLNKATNQIVCIFRAVFLVVKTSAGFRLLITHISKEVKNTVDFVKMDKDKVLKTDWPFKNDGDGVYIDTFNGYRMYFCTEYDDMNEVRQRLKANFSRTNAMSQKENIIYAEAVYV